MFSLFSSNVSPVAFLSLYSSTSILSAGATISFPCFPFQIFVTFTSILGGLVCSNLFVIVRPSSSVPPYVTLYLLSPILILQSFSPTSFTVYTIFSLPLYSSRFVKVPLQLLSFVKTNSLPVSDPFANSLTVTLSGRLPFLLLSSSHFFLH